MMAVWRQLGSRP